MAPIPDGPAHTTWQGEISHGDQRSETVIATARTLLTEVIGDKEYLWIEVTCTSVMAGRPDYWEGARLLVDAATYDKTQTFLIQQGWIAYGTPDNVFKIPDSGDLDELLGARLQMQQQPETDRVNTIDILSMLFNADLKPPTPISRLRARISGVLAGTNRASIPEIRQIRIGRTIGDCWISPKLPGLHYTFFRSLDVPFGFAFVNLTAQGITINLEVDSKGDSLARDFSTSVFGTTAELLELSERNMARMPKSPNWRVWTWRDDERIYMAWAEFGGTIKSQAGRDVLLRNIQGNEICVPEGSLAEQDVKFVAQGRYWTSFSANQQRVLLEDNVSKLKFQLSDGEIRTFVGPLPHNGAESDADQTWLDALRAAIKRNANSTGSMEDWRAFAGYVR